MIDWGSRRSKAADKQQQEQKQQQQWTMAAQNEVLCSSGGVPPFINLPCQWEKLENSFSSVFLNLLHHH